MLKQTLVLGLLTLSGLYSAHEKIGISRTSLSYKINNIVEFNAQEIKHIQKILELSNEQRDHIFFAEAVDK